MLLFKQHSLLFVLACLTLFSTAAPAGEVKRYDAVGRRKISLPKSKPKPAPAPPKATPPKATTPPAKAPPTATSKPPPPATTSKAAPPTTSSTGKAAVTSSASAVTSVTSKLPPTSTSAVSSKSASTTSAVSSASSSSSSAASSATSQSASRSSSAVSSSASASASAASCPLKPKGSSTPTKGKRVPELPPASFTLTLDGVSRPATTLGANAGQNGAVWTVNWPDPQAGGEDSPGFAKTLKADAILGTFQNEVKATTQVGQTLASGQDCDGREWLVTRKADGKAFKDTPALQSLGCDAAKEKAKQSVLDAVTHFATQFGVVHQDPSPENAFFSDDLSTATLIDWGNPKFSKTVPQLVTKAKVNQLWANAC